MISIIVPVYNAEKYLVRCINSILNQSYRKLELILVDDGSKDNSGLICDNYANIDSRVSVLHVNNGGVSSARNIGLKTAKGEYVSFVDSDDYMKEDAYEQLYKCAYENDADVVACDYTMVLGGQEHICASFKEGRDRIETISNMISFGPRGGNIFSFIMVKRSLINDNGLAFPTHLSWAEDFWFTLHSYVYADKIEKVSLSLYCYNFDNENSATHNEPESALIHKKKCLEECIAFLKESNLWDQLKKEMSWRVLLEKTSLVMAPSLIKEYYSFLPEVNSYVEDNPLLSSRMKYLMKLLNNKHSLIATLLIRTYTLQSSIKKR